MGTPIGRYHEGSTNTHYALHMLRFKTVERLSLSNSREPLVCVGKPHHLTLAKVLRGPNPIDQSEGTHCHHKQSEVVT